MIRLLWTPALRMFTCRIDHLELYTMHSWNISRLKFKYTCKLYIISVCVYLLFSERQSLPNFDIPDTFWLGKSKLAWPSDDLQFVFTSFPTVYIAFALHDNQTQEFSLGVTPQVCSLNVTNSDLYTCIQYVCYVRVACI